MRIHKTQARPLLLSLLLAAALAFGGCGSTEQGIGTPVTEGDAGTTTEQSGSAAAGSSASREPSDDFLMPEASGTAVFSNDDGTVTIDYSNTLDGYVMVKDTNDRKAQIQITNPDGSVYPYPLVPGDYRVFPLTLGSGAYQISVLEQVSGNNYAIGLSENFDVKLKNEFCPFLIPNQYVNYTPDSQTVALGKKLYEGTASDLEYVQNVYNYVIKNISYDNDLAANTPVNYIPDPDATLKSGKGICFDYASLMTAILRSQKVPTKLEVGYSGDVYHAWISVYLKDIGWVDNIISFDGKNWTLMDPTLGANNNAEEVKKYVGDGSNYMTKYTY